MKNKIVLSLAVASLLVSPLNALNMLERFEAMEKEMKALKAEIALLKSSDNPVDEIDDSKEITDIGDSEEIGVIGDSDADDKSDSDSDDKEDEDEDKPSIEEELEEIKDNLSDLNKATSGSHL
ncbi:MAG: DUF3373 domain-containing protein, partial [Helicobacteraceae bacterium]|nr:DUF3373 domain-containing protein [Candidatus Sulfurimonas ponti]